MKRVITFIFIFSLKFCFSQDPIFTQYFMMPETVNSGFTGAYTWADPESEILYVFLSNRVFPTMENTGLVDEDIRTKIQQIIQDAILPE